MSSRLNYFSGQCFPTPRTPAAPDAATGMARSAARPADGAPVPAVSAKNTVSAPTYMTPAAIPVIRPFLPTAAAAVYPFMKAPTVMKAMMMPVEESMPIAVKNSISPLMRTPAAAAATAAANHFRPLRTPAAAVLPAFIFLLIFSPVFLFFFILYTSC